MTSYVLKSPILAVFPKELFPHFDPIRMVRLEEGQQEGNVFVSTGFDMGGQAGEGASRVNEGAGSVNVYTQRSTGACYTFEGEGAMPTIEEIAQGNLWRGIGLGFTPFIAGIAAVAEIIHATYQVGKTVQEVYTSRRAGDSKGLIELFNENAAKFDPAWRTAATAATIGLLYFGAEATRDPISACIPGFNLGIAVAATVYGLRNPLKFWELAGRLEKWCLGTERTTHKIFGGRVTEFNL